MVYVGSELLLYSASLSTASA